MAERDAVLIVAPAQHVRAVATTLAPRVRDGQPVVMCAKGIEQASGKLMGDILAETLPEVTQAVAVGTDLCRRRRPRASDRADHRVPR